MPAAMRMSIPDCRVSSPCFPPCITATGPAKASTSTCRWPRPCCRSMSGPARMLSGIDTDGEPIALSANESAYFRNERRHPTDYRGEPDLFADVHALLRDDAAKRPAQRSALCDGEASRGKILPPLLAEIRRGSATFDNLEQLQAQISEAGLAVGRMRTVSQFADSDWVKEWNAVVEVDDRAGGMVRMPGQSRGSSAVPNCRLPECPHFRASTMRKSWRSSACPRQVRGYAAAKRAAEPALGGNRPAHAVSINYRRSASVARRAPNGCRGALCRRLSVVGRIDLGMSSAVQRA